MSVAQNKLTMDKIPDELAFISDMLATAAGRLDLLDAGSRRSRKVTSDEIAAIKTEVAAALVKLNDLRTLAAQASWRVLAEANGVKLPEDGDGTDQG